MKRKIMITTAMAAMLIAGTVLSGCNAAGNKTADATGGVAVCQYVTDGRAPGIAAEMAGKVVGSYPPPLPP